jgi:hypothetical protein
MRDGADSDATFDRAIENEVWITADWKEVSALRGRRTQMWKLDKKLCLLFEHGQEIPRHFCTDVECIEVDSLGKVQPLPPATGNRSRQSVADAGDGFGARNPSGLAASNALLTTICLFGPSSFPLWISLEAADEPVDEARAIRLREVQRFGFKNFEWNRHRNLEVAG